MDTETMMMQFPITREAWETAGRIFVGLAIPCNKSTVDLSHGIARPTKIIPAVSHALRVMSNCIIIVSVSIVSFSVGVV